MWELSAAVGLGWALSLHPKSLCCAFPQWRIQDCIWGHCLEPPEPAAHPQICCTHPSFPAASHCSYTPKSILYLYFRFHLVCVAFGSSWGDVLNAGNPCALTAPAAPTLSWGVPTTKTQPLEFCLAWTSKLRLLPGIVSIKEQRWEGSESVVLFHHFAVIKISVQAQIPFVHYISNWLQIIASGRLAGNCKHCAVD